MFRFNDKVKDQLLSAVAVAQIPKKVYGKIIVPWCALYKFNLATQKI